MICYQPTNNDITKAIFNSNKGCGSNKLVLQRVPGNKLMVVQQPHQQCVDQHQHKKLRQVKFSTLTVRSYPCCPGYFHVTSDSGGPQISMARNYQSEITYPSVDVYETKTKTTLTKARGADLKVPSQERDELLRRYGYSLAERQQATKQSTITRNQRKKSNRGADRSLASSFWGLHFKKFKNKNNKNNKNNNRNNKNKNMNNKRT